MPLKKLIIITCVLLLSSCQSNLISLNKTKINSSNTHESSGIINNKIDKKWKENTKKLIKTGQIDDGNFFDYNL